MSDGRNYKRSRRAWELAGRQHGVVARRHSIELAAATLAPEHRAASTRAAALMRGVCIALASVTPRAALDGERLLRAAGRARGECLSHRSAAAAWHRRRSADGDLDVSVMPRAGP